MNPNEEKVLAFLECAANYASKIMREELDKLATEITNILIIKNENLFEPPDYSFPCHVEIPVNETSGQLTLLENDDEIQVWLDAVVRDKLIKSIDHVKAVINMPPNKNKILLLKFNDYLENAFALFCHVICRNNLIPIAAIWGSTFGEKRRFLHIPIDFCLYEKCEYKKVENHA